MTKVKKFCILAFFLLFFSFNVGAQTIEEVKNNLIIDVDGLSILRSGSNATIRPVIINNNTIANVTLTKIEFLNSSNTVIDSIIINTDIKAIAFEIDEANNLFTQIKQGADLNYLRNRTEYLEETMPLGIYDLGISLNINDYYSNPAEGSSLLFIARIEFNYSGETETIQGNHSVYVSTSLPSPAHNSPGWYKGDQHVHSEWSENPFEINLPSISDMSGAAIQAGYEWILFTDHSDSYAFNDIFNGETNWNNANQECENEDTSSFECIYGQELAVKTDSSLTCDRGHYLTYDSTPSFIYAGCDTFCFCYYQAQTKIDELNNNGGFGFIAHPHTTESFFGVVPDWEDWSVTGFRGLEIINEEFDNDDAHAIYNPGGETDSWREFLVDEDNPSNGFVPGIANSDAHMIEHLGLSFTYCYLDSLSQTNVVNSIKDGHCISTTGPFIEFTIDNAIIGDTVDVATGSNLISFNANSTAEFGELDYLLVYVDNEPYTARYLSGFSYSDSIEVTLTSQNKYVRLVLYTEDDHQAYTNPIWVNVTDCECTVPEPGQCGGGSCSSSHRQYTRSCTPDACAAEELCIFDESCVEGNNNPPTSELFFCDEPGHESCIGTEAIYEEGGEEVDLCTAQIATNLYTNVNNIKWGNVNSSNDPYVIGNYKIGWRGVDTNEMYYNVVDPENDCEFGGCNTGQLIDNDEGNMTTVTAPGIAFTETILGYDESWTLSCWLWYYDFYPYYRVDNQNRSIFVLNCFEDEDCSSNNYCSKSGSWNSWSCVSKKIDGQSCTQDNECQSGYCDNDNLGLGDDGWCFTPSSTYFDGQESSYCEYSTGQGATNCDEMQAGDDLDSCIDVPYYEDECSSICGIKDIISAFECTDGGCSCGELLCDGLTPGANISSCSNEETYFADECTIDANGQDREGTICRSSTFAQGCTADIRCEGIEAGNGQCNLDCSYNENIPSNSTITYPNGGEVFTNFVTLNWTDSVDPDGWFTRYILEYSDDSGQSWNPIISDYGFVNSFNDSSTEKTLQFTGNQTYTLYIKLPKNSRIMDAGLELTGGAT